MRNSRKGFTFVEILVAMAFFGALTAVAVPKYRSFRERAFVATMRTELGSLRVAEEAHWAENMAYSTDTTSLDWNGSSGIQLTIASSDLTGGFFAIARHVSAPGTQCATYVGREATSTPSGEIVCTAATAPPGTAIPSP